MSISIDYHEGDSIFNPHTSDLLIDSSPDFLSNEYEAVGEAKGAYNVSGFEIHFSKSFFS